MFGNRMVLALAAAVRLMAIIGAIAVFGAIMFAPDLFLKVDLAPADARAMQGWAGICFGALMLAYFLPILIASTKAKAQKGFLARANAQSGDLGARPIMRLMFALSQVFLLLFVVFGEVSRN
jgi:hypothetical protein